MGGRRRGTTSLRFAASVQRRYHGDRKSVPSRLSADAFDVASVLSHVLCCYMRVRK
jgi:hypothetical protein